MLVIQKVLAISDTRTQLGVITMNKHKKLSALFRFEKIKQPKLLYISALFGGIFSIGVAAQSQPYSQLSKQLDIMNNIFTSSLQADGNKPLKNTKIESLYLAGQGIVFTVNSPKSYSWNRHAYSYSFSDSVASVEPLAPLPPVAPVAPKEHASDFEYFNSDELAEQMESAYELQREYFRDFRDQQRDLAYELRDLERESKDLAYQLRNVSKAEKIALVEEQKTIEKAKAKIEKARIALKEKSQKMKKQQQISKAKNLAERKEHYRKLASALVETLCTYGNSLKALPKGEHVSLVLKSAGDKVERGYQDKVLVLTKRDITACAIDKISAEKLLTSAKNYQF